MAIHKEHLELKMERFLNAIQFDKVVENVQREASKQLQAHVPPEQFVKAQACLSMALADIKDLAITTSAKVYTEEEIDWQIKLAEDPIFLSIYKKTPELFKILNPEIEKRVTAAMKKAFEFNSGL